MFFDLQKLCEEFNRGFPPSTNFYQLCEFANNKESGSRIAFGLLSKGLYNENAFLCVNLTNQVVNADSGNNLVCTSAAVHYFEGAAAATTGESTCPMNRALVLAVGGLTLFSDNTKYVPYTPPTKPPKKQDPLFALYVVLIILAAIVFVTFCAYLADYFIQPAPPLKALVPVRAVGAENMNLNHNNNANKSNYVDFAGRLLEGAMNNGAVERTALPPPSPSRRHRRGRPYVGGAATTTVVLFQRRMRTTITFRET
ncbi:hypothetical protein AGDE_16148 [Angomonas deanei]|uniref:Uncharacterized protein n=1 Tax=Angomonas deanei TaxID=59799 RepID=A0A7G2CL84_9TRYP|nr:hypothetical protein AGDE_16148 [Angomonas deanei]CAD2220618.1 hypothetical protein, conserved [Angomonas deanei]|eukprot:EPY17645.1 hypothetical protein AGDE_16148 [Angomonas deanei]